MSRIVPTVGRNILVKRGSELTAGIITTVLPYSGEGPYKIGVSIQPNVDTPGWGGWHQVKYEEMGLVEGDDAIPTHPLTVYAEWMPYQVQKAAAEASA